MFSSPDVNNILSITKLNRFAKRVLESEIGLVWATGEISNFIAAASGHWYFSLKDSKAQVRTAMFKGSNQRVGFKPKNGDKVLVRGSLSIYEPRGDYQLIIQHLEHDGIGQLKREFERLKQQLSQQGLFSEEHKKAIPEQISTIGIVTSPTGAAIHDVLTVFSRRNPAINVILYPALVQGASAAQEIVNQIEKANQRNEVDALIVGRGGGSLEDLWPFNEESVARAIFDSNIPVVSAVGHEIDVTISDFVADRRAPTPSAAAELLSIDKESLNTQLVQMYNRLNYQIKNHLTQLTLKHQIAQKRLERLDPQQQIQNNSQRLDALMLRFNAMHPVNKVKDYQTKLHELNEQLINRYGDTYKRRKEKLAYISHRLLQSSPSDDIVDMQARIDNIQKRLQHTIVNKLEKTKMQLASNSGLLDSVSPLNTLKRGYSISYKDEKILKHIADVQTSDTLVTKLSDGTITSSITKLSPKSSN